MPPYRIFTYLASSWLMGVGIGELAPLSFFILYCILLITIIGSITLRKSSVVAGIFVLVGVMVLGVFYAQFREHKTTSKDIELYNGRKVSIEGVVHGLPDIRETHQKINLSVSHVEDRPVNGQLLLLLDKKQKTSIGDTIIVYCLLEQPKPIDDFSYDKYLARFSIYSICAFPQDQKIVVNEQKNFTSILYSARTYLEKNIEKSIVEPAASLIKGILLGDKAGLGEDLSEVFRRTGLSHIVVLSGYNISVLVAIILAVGPYLFFSRRVLFVAITFAIVSFVLMTGASPSVIRAGFMGWLVLVAYENRRLPHSINLLLGTAVIMVVVNPKILIWDVGWQLSFLATFAMLEIVPELSYRLRRLPMMMEIRDAIIMTLSAILITSPLIIWHFGGISVVAIIANIIVVPLVPFAMIGGLITGVLGSSLPFSFLWTIPTWATLTFIINVSSFLSTLPYAFLGVPRIAGAVLAFTLSTLIISYILKNKYAF